MRQTATPMTESNIQDSSKPEPQSPELTALRKALQRGDIAAVRDLIDAGTDTQYRTAQGYDALIDAAHAGCGDQPLLDLLRLLIERGVDLSGESSYGESGLRVLSRRGRFDAVKLLLEAGADEGQLGWTDLMRAVALGTLADVKAALAAGAALEARDRWSRTAWLIAVLAGDLAKAQLLMDAGADTAARALAGQPPLFFAIEGGHPAMVRWLLDTVGADVDQADDFGQTPLATAAERGDLASVNLLLEAGAHVGDAAGDSPLSRASTRAVALRLIEAGADPADANQRVMLKLPDPEVGSGATEPLDAITAGDYQRGRRPVFGQGNPERMDIPFWIAMIRAGVTGFQARAKFEPDSDPLDGPIWSAQRFGQSLTLLPDGRAIQIGGEHEDSYDPDFRIYNDVFVHQPDGSIEIYAYPEDVFPPTDFHTATLVGAGIYIIGGLGYPGARTFGQTPVYRLDLASLRIERLRVRGAAPGWIYKHRAEPVGANAIRVWGGTIVTQRAAGEAHDSNPATFRLDLRKLTWRTEVGG